MCVCVTRLHPAKTAGQIEIPFGMCGGVGPSKHALDGGADLPKGRAILE